MKQSIVMISPADAVSDANALCMALGWGSDNFLIALSADGAEPATHFGLRASESPDFAAALSAALEADVLLNELLIVDIRADTDRALQFETITAETGLQRVAVPVVV